MVQRTNYSDKILSLILEQISADNTGQTLMEYKEHQEFSCAVREKSKQYENKPSSEWPKIEINWDLKKESQKFSLDGVKEKDFKTIYPEGFSLGYVSLAEFDKTLCRFSRRDFCELWKVGSTSKLSYLIVYLSEGHPISPPLVSLNSELPGQTIFHGGHHRYAIAKEISEITIPIHVEPKNKTAMDKIISINWV